MPLPSDTFEPFGSVSVNWIESPACGVAVPGLTVFRRAVKVTSWPTTAGEVGVGTSTIAELSLPTVMAIGVALLLLPM